MSERAVLAAKFSPPKLSDVHSHASLSLSVFQGGSEHNVPVVISKIFKDQVGKKVFYVATVAWPLERFSVWC